MPQQTVNVFAFSVLLKSKVALGSHVPDVMWAIANTAAGARAVIDAVVTTADEASVVGPTQQITGAWTSLTGTPGLRAADEEEETSSKDKDEEATSKDKEKEKDKHAVTAKKH